MKYSLVVRVDRYIRRNVGVYLPWYYKYAYTKWGLDYDIYAWWGLHWLLRLLDKWQWHRWCLERHAIRLGCYKVEEGAVLNSGKWL